MLLNKLNRDPKGNSEELAHQRKRKKEIEDKILKLKALKEQTQLSEAKEETLHGDEDLNESFNLEKNLGKNWGDDLDGVDGLALKSVSKNSYAVAYKDKNAIILKTDKAEVRLDGSMIDQLYRLLKRRN